MTEEEKGEEDADADEKQIVFQQPPPEPLATERPLFVFIGEWVRISIHCIIAEYLCDPFFPS